MRRTVCSVAAIALAAAFGFAATNISEEKYTATERRHWSFQPRSQPAIPAFTAPRDKSWVKNPIDAFILDRLKKEGLPHAPLASKQTLIRRVYYDLTGLPPTPAEVAAFVADPRPDAYEKLVDKLLASPRYGERWGQHWLDVVRFAESDGFEYDTHRPDAWRYRDYVIKSFNDDKPYDQFLREQLAGDEMEPTNHEAIIASGFNRLAALRKNAGNQEVASSRNEVLTEMTNIVGSALLGVTLGCARCHDHKFDPLRQKDYYRMQAFFAPVHENDFVTANEEERKQWEAKNKELDEQIKKLRGEMKGLKGEERGRMFQRIRDTEAQKPGPLPGLYGVRNDMEKRSPIHVLARGDYQNKGDSVGMRTLGVLLPDGTPELDPNTPKPRTVLANWITSPDHPLTARVMVNRLWAYHFGRGIVASPNDFGRMGARPKHRELLDYLANQFVDGGWKLKPLHKTIVMSSTYRQAATSPPSAAGMAKHPDNELLWKYSRRRLTAEEVRDSMLTAAGRLNLKAGGPSIMVPVDEELTKLLYKPGQWQVAKDKSEHDRRSVYLMYKRNLRLPIMEAFDAPDMLISCPRREQSTHAPQALELMNGPFANEIARTFAARLDAEAKTPDAQVTLAYRLTAGRAPSLQEKKIALDFLKANPLSEFALAILNLNAFLYVD
ncbi:MAG: DUF1549 domain-containing protein [Bryobacterales bacterium]|nr:DUF1549 domain-containing protein [Bryobacterales bacterium]